MPTAVYTPAAPMPQSFAPTMQYAPQGGSHTQIYQPPAKDWLEDSEVQWDEAEPVFEAPAPEPPLPRQSSMDYYRDVQSGFAPAVPPHFMLPARIAAKRLLLKNPANIAAAA